MRGVRARLTVTLVALVALTAGLLALGAYVFVDTRLHDQTRDDAADQARFDLTVLIPRSGLPADPTADDIVASGVLGTLHQRGVETIVARGCGRACPFEHRARGRARQRCRPTSRRVSRTGSSPTPGPTSPAGRAWSSVGGSEPGGPDFYFVHDATDARAGARPAQARTRASGSWRRSSSRSSSRGRSRAACSRPSRPPVRPPSGSHGGDLTARVPVTSDDEFGQWARRFNEMADVQAGTIGRLEAAEAQNRRFVADVAHELRTPLAALVAEASILREHLDGLPAGSRRAAELLVSDVARLRTLVDDLMEISRFDARAEQVETRAGGRRRASSGRSRPRVCPEATVVVPDAPGRHRLGPASARADPRQPPRQRPRARAGRARRGRADERAGRG